LNLFRSFLKRFVEWWGLNVISSFHTKFCKTFLSHFPLPFGYLNKNLNMCSKKIETQSFIFFNLFEICIEMYCIWMFPKKSVIWRSHLFIEENLFSNFKMIQNGNLDQPLDDARIEVDIRNDRNFKMLSFHFQKICTYNDNVNIVQRNKNILCVASKLRHCWEFGKCSNN
jgi:hypothetical protein